MFITEITDKLILGLDILEAQAVSVVLAHCTLRLSNEEMPLRVPESRPRSPPSNEGQQ